MSLGIFRSIRGSYGQRAQSIPEKIIQGLNEHLPTLGLAKYSDPDTNERGLRPLPCGNAGSSTFQALEELAASSGLQWTLGKLQGHRQIALPLQLPGVITVKIPTSFFMTPKVQQFCSVRQVLEELIAIAPSLRVELLNGQLSDELLRQIADEAPLFEGDENEVLRSLWLDLYLVAKYCLEDQRPLVIG